MMRFQRISPDCVPLSNGKKSSLRTTSVIKEDNNGSENGRTSTLPTFTPNFESKAAFRFRSPSKTPDHHHHHHHHNSNGGASPLAENHHHHHHHHRDSSPSPSRTTGGDVLLQWGQKKRARASRVVTDDSSASAQAVKVQRRSLLSSPRSPAAAAPPPPPPPPPPNGRVGSLRREGHGIRESHGLLLPKRNLEERSGVANRSPSRTSGGMNRPISRSATAKRSPSAPEKAEKKVPLSGSAKVDDKLNGSIHDHRNRSDSAPSEQEGRNNHSSAAAAAEKATVEVIEWPRIYIALSRKEKEDDFLAMKGTKLPHRPKKRAKNIDKTLQYCFPGMWLSDLTKSRYEVREKKCVKKQKRRGLKGMESMDSDSE